MVESFHSLGGGGSLVPKSRARVLEFGKLRRSVRALRDKQAESKIRLYEKRRFAEINAPREASKKRRK